MMKKTVFYLSVLVLLAACTRQQLPSWSSQTIQFSAEELSAKTAFLPDGGGISAFWTQDDTIGIWCSTSNRGNYPYVANVGRDDASRAVFGVVSEDRMFLYDGQPSVYYAYYPYRPSNGNTPEITFSVPSAQVQTAAGDPSFLSALQPFRADPVSISGENAQVNFSFHPVLSTVHLSLGMKDGEMVSVPVRMVKLIAASTDLASPEVSLHIDDAEAKPQAASGSREVSLGFDTLPVLVSGAEADTWMTVLPGAHGSGLSCEVTAIDGSVATMMLPAVTFAGGHSYRQSLRFALSDFVQAEPFDITASALTVKAGEPLTFQFQGSAAKIVFWSGEKFHDYAYATADRIEYGQVFMSFLQALLSGDGRQGDCLKVKLSTDYDGTLSETAILNATWIDMTDEFKLDTSISGSGNPTTAANYGKFKKSADVAVSKYAGGKPFRIVFFWSALPDLGGRTVSWITGLKVWDSEGVLMNQEDNTVASGKAFTDYDPVLIEGASYGSDTNHCGWYAISGAATTNCFRFFSAFTLTGTEERHAYGVVNNLFTPKQTNLGHDTPVPVQAESEETPASWSYTFMEPGTYKVVFEASCPTLAGDKTELREFTITVE